MKKSTKNTHGGARPGAGNKSPVTKKSIQVTIDIELFEYLNSFDNRSAIVNEALIEYKARKNLK